MGAQEVGAGRGGAGRDGAGGLVGRLSDLEDCLFQGDRKA